MRRRILIASTILATLATQTSFLAFAQTNVVREAIPAQRQVIVANSPQDIALQEEIARIRAYNAGLSQVGISESYSTESPAFTASIAPISQYQGRTIEMFEAPETQITYASTTVQPTYASTYTTAVVPGAIVERQPIASYSRIHHVVADDTLYRLAKSNCVSVIDIQNLNNMSDNNIRIGQAITLPVNQCGASTIAATTTAATTTRSDFGIVRRVLPIQAGINVRSGNAYAVLPKDSLYSIGRRYCVSAGEIAGFNGIDTATPIQPGQVLRLPSTACK